MYLSVSLKCILTAASHLFPFLSKRGWLSRLAWVFMTTLFKFKCITTPEIPFQTLQNTAVFVCRRVEAHLPIMHRSILRNANGFPLHSNVLLTNNSHNSLFALRYLNVKFRHFDKLLIYVSSHFSLEICYHPRRPKCQDQLFLSRLICKVRSPQRLRKRFTAHRFVGVHLSRQDID